MHENYDYIERESEFLYNKSEIDAVSKILQLQLHPDLTIDSDTLYVLGRWLEVASAKIEEPFYELYEIARECIEEERNAKRTNQG